MVRNCGRWLNKFCFEKVNGSELRTMILGCRKNSGRWWPARRIRLCKISWSQSSAAKTHYQHQHQNLFINKRKEQKRMLIIKNLRLSKQIFWSQNFASKMNCIHWWTQRNVQMNLLYFLRFSIPPLKKISYCIPPLKKCKITWRLRFNKNRMNLLYFLGFATSEKMQNNVKVKVQ